MARPAKVVLTPVVTGDTWDGITVALSSTGTAFAQPLALAEMIFVDLEGAVGLSISSATAAVVINNAATWNVTVAPRTVTLADGFWHWSFRTTDSAGTIKTRLSGTITVLPRDPKI